jgi:SNF2 family DNA or RNA helicase
LAHPASCAYGLNLQDGGNHVIWFGLTWSLELYQQANARIFRQGQQAQRVFIHRLIVAESADERVVEVLNDKGETQDKLLEWLKTKIKKAKEGKQA